MLQGCVYKRIIFPLSDYPVQGARGSSLAFDPWFCPAHFCASCSALEQAPPSCEETDIAVATSCAAGNGAGAGGDVPFPLFVVASGLHRSRKELHGCAKCPFSLCLECLDDAHAEGPYGEGCSGQTSNDMLFRQVPARVFNETGEVVEDFVVRDKKVRARTTLLCYVACAR